MPQEAGPPDATIVVVAFDHRSNPRWSPAQLFDCSQALIAADIPECWQRQADVLGFN